MIRRREQFTEHNRWRVCRLGNRKLLDATEREKFREFHAEHLPRALRNILHDARTTQTS
jgi:hypothetical protein